MDGWLIFTVAVVVALALIAWEFIAVARAHDRSRDELELPGFLPGERDEWRRRG